MKLFLRHIFRVPQFISAFCSSIFNSSSSSACSMMFQGKFLPFSFLFSYLSFFYSQELSFFIYDHHQKFVQDSFVKFRARTGTSLDKRILHEFFKLKTSINNLYGRIGRFAPFFEHFIFFIENIIRR